MADNNIFLYASEAKSTETKSSTDGAYFKDSNWKADNARKAGATQGLASSVEYNTVLRQVSLMARTFAQIIVNRGNISVSAETSEDENSSDVLTTRVSEYAGVFSTYNFLHSNEVKDKHIDTSSVITRCVADKAITSAKLGDLLEGGKEAITTINNGIEVTLSQKAGTGFSVSVTSSAVELANKAEKVKNKTTNDKFYLMGRAGIPSDSDSNYVETLCNTNLYVDTNGTLRNVGRSIEALSYNATSDAALKKNIRYSHIDGRCIVDSVDIVDFEYTSSPDEEQLGVIAQDLQKVCPELVIEGDDGYLRIKESKLVYVLWRALQQAYRDVDKLTYRLDILESAVQQMLNDKEN